MNFTLIAVLGLVAGVIAALVGAFRSGAAKERVVAQRDRAQAEAAAATERLKMQAEAKRIEDEVADLTETELDAELTTWARSQR